MIIRRIARLLALGMVLPAACAGDPAASDRVAPADLARIVGPQRPFEARLSTAPRHRPCGPIPAAPAAPRRCATLPPPGSRAHARVLRLAARAGSIADERPDAAALRVLGLIELLWSEPGKSLDASVELLREATLLAPDDAASWSDLAAAHLVRFEADGSLADLLHALEAVEAARELEPEHPAANFNLALTWERIGLTVAAEETWTRYADDAPRDGWAREARDRAARLLAARPPRFDDRALLDDDAPPAAIADAAVRDPEGAREFAMDHALRAWGDAVLAGDTAAARRWLERARAVGQGLAEAGLDQTVLRAVASIESTSPARSTEGGHPEAGDRTRLARLHSGYGAARARYTAGDDAGARRLFASVVRLATPADDPLRAWALFYHGATLVNTGEMARASMRLQQALELTDPMALPVLTGRVAWARAVAARHAERWAEALESYRGAYQLVRAAGEWQSMGALEGMIGQTELMVGRNRAALQWRHRALLRLGHSRGPVWLHNALIITAQLADDLGLPRAAMALQTEGVTAGAATQEPVWAAEALLRRARLSLRQDRPGAALRDMDRARAVAARVESESTQAWLHADLLSLAGEAARPQAVGQPREGGSPTESEPWSSPGRLVAALDTAVAYFDSLGSAVRLTPLLTARGQLLLRLQAIEAAERDLRRVLELVDLQREDRTEPAQRAALLDAARPAFDALVSLELKRGRVHDALWIAERSRAVLGPRETGGEGRALQELSAGLPAHAAALAYTVLGDSLVIWTIHAGRLMFRRTPLSRADVARRVERLRVAGARGASEAALGSDLEALHELLVAPVRDRIGDARLLLVVPDDVLHGVPFSALKGDDGYLVQRAAVQVAPSLELAVSRGAHGPAVPDRPGTPAPLLVAAPAGDGAELPALPGALQEIAMLRELYAGATVLDFRAGATFEHLTRGLATARLFHFAGHAVSDPRRPDQSYLQLGGGADRRLGAEEIRRMRLDGLDLAVLSSCHTLTAAGTRSGGFDGVARSFLAAGARGVLGTLWAVEDAVAREVVVRFHAAYQAGLHPAEALRATQLELIASRDPTLASPAAWAAFRYVGR